MFIRISVGQSERKAYLQIKMKSKILSLNPIEGENKHS